MPSTKLVSRPVIFAWILVAPLLAQTFNPMSPAEQENPVGQTELSGSEVFRRVAPAIFVVEGMNRKGVTVIQGSAVAISPTSVVTNKHVIEHAVKIRLRQNDKYWPASVIRTDSQHDLCLCRSRGLVRNMFDFAMFRLH